MNPLTAWSPLASRPVTRYAMGVGGGPRLRRGVAVVRPRTRAPGKQGSASAEAAIPSESSTLAAAAQSSVFGSTSTASTTRRFKFRRLGQPGTAASPPVVQSSGS